MRTYSPKIDEIERDWHVVDADGLVLGRLATEVALRLRGKHKPTFAPHMDTGDHVIIINADKGGLTETTYADRLAQKPADAVRRTVRGMLPKNRLGRQMLKKLKVYTSAEFQDLGGHPHGAQNPQPLQLEHARARTGA